MTLAMLACVALTSSPCASTPHHVKMRALRMVFDPSPLHLSPLQVAQLRQALDGMSLKCEHLTNKLLLYTNGRRSSQTVSSVEATSGRVDGAGAPPELQRRTSAPKPKDAVGAPTELCDPSVCRWPCRCVQT